MIPRRSFGLVLIFSARHHQFVTVDDVYAPVNDSSKDMCHISHGLDASTHFQTVSEDVWRLYRDGVRIGHVNDTSGVRKVGYKWQS